MKIKLCNVTFGYTKKNTILKGVDYTFERGNTYVIKGANGSGKTTLSMLIMGLLKPQGGEAQIDDRPIKKRGIADTTSQIGYLFQNTEIQLFANTVYEELAFPYIIKGDIDKYKEKIDRILVEFGLEELKESFPMLLSGGEKQRLALATIIIREVSFLILDEPTSSIDDKSKAYLAAFIKNFVAEGGGVILITHDDNFCELLENKTQLTLREGLLYEA